VISFASTVVGAGVTCLIQALALRYLRSHYFAHAFYRGENRRTSNIINLVVESVNLGTVFVSTAIRLIRLIFVTSLYFGRVDVPMLASHAGLVGRVIYSDAAVESFKTDLLLHDAHRHPYIERIGLLYLMKVHNGKDFGSRAGAYWRLLFVLAIMPWLRTYRVRPETTDDIGGQDDASSIASSSRRSQRTDDIHGLRRELELTQRALKNCSTRLRGVADQVLAKEKDIKRLRNELKEAKRPREFDC